MTANYEITFIVQPDLDDASIDAVVDQVRSRIQAAGGEIIATVPFNPARRRMAYPIKDYGDGVYITITFNIDSEAIREFENGLRLNERILRFLVVQATEQMVKQQQQRLAQRMAAPAPPPGQPVPAGTVPAAPAPPAEPTPVTAEAVEAVPVSSAVATAAPGEDAPVNEVGVVPELAPAPEAAPEVEPVAAAPAEAPAE